MLEYNDNVLNAGINGLVAFQNRLREERREFIKPYHEEYHALDHEYFLYQQTEIKAQPQFFDEEKHKQFMLRKNAITIRATDAYIPVFIEHYKLLGVEAQRVWETMLPFARATAKPMENTAFLYHWCSRVALDPLFDANHLPYDSFYENVEPSPETVMANEMAIAAEQIAKEKEEAERVKEQIKAQAALEKALSAAFDIGPVGFKLTPNAVEVEYVNIVAARASFDWKSKQAEAGLGLGFKKTLALVGAKGTGLGVEATTYANVAFDVRNKTVTDFYISSDARSSFGGFSSGVNYRFSVYNDKGGWGLANSKLSTSVSQKFGALGVSHSNELLSVD